MTTTVRDLVRRAGSEISGPALRNILTVFGEPDGWDLQLIECPGLAWPLPRSILLLSPPEFELPESRLFSCSGDGCEVCHGSGLLAAYRLERYLLAGDLYRLRTERLNHRQLLVGWQNRIEGHVVDDVPRPDAPRWVRWMTARALDLVFAPARMILVVLLKLTELILDRSDAVMIFFRLQTWKFRKWLKLKVRHPWKRIVSWIDPVVRVPPKVIRCTSCGSPVIASIRADRNGIPEEVRLHCTLDHEWEEDAWAETDTAVNRWVREDLRRTQEPCAESRCPVCDHELTCHRTFSHGFLIYVHFECDQGHNSATNWDFEFDALSESLEADTRASSPSSGAAMVPPGVATCPECGGSLQFALECPPSEELDVFITCCRAENHDEKWESSREWEAAHAAAVEWVGKRFIVEKLRLSSDE